MHAIGCLWLNVRGTYLRQPLLAQALHMLARRPTILILAEAQSKADPEDPPFPDCTRYVVLPAHGKTGSGLDMYVRAGTTTRATLLWGKKDAITLLMEVMTPWGTHHVLAAHAPKSTLAVSHMCDGGQALARGHLHRGHGDRFGGDRHQLNGPTGGLGNPVPR